MNFKFKNDEPVSWDPEITRVPVGYGWVVGYSSSELPVIGAMAMVEVLGSEHFPNPQYPFKVVSIADCHLNFGWTK